MTNSNTKKNRHTARPPIRKSVSITIHLKGSCSINHPKTFPQEPTGNHTPPQLSPSLSQAYPNAGSLDVQHLIMQADARRRRNDNYFEDVPRSKLERQMAQVSMVSQCTCVKCTTLPCPPALV